MCIRDRYLDRLQAVRVVLDQKRGMHTVEITVEEPRHVFRSEKASSDVLEAFDDAYKAVEKQVRRHKRRRRDHTKQSVRLLEPVVPEDLAREPTPEPVEDDDAEEDDGPDIIRVKSHALKPMVPEEAAMQMEMVGHDFYVFTDARTENVAVVYRRKSGGSTGIWVRSPWWKSLIWL